MTKTETRVQSRSIGAEPPMAGCVGGLSAWHGGRSCAADRRRRRRRGHSESHAATHTHRKRAMPDSRQPPQRLRSFLSASSHWPATSLRSKVEDFAPVHRRPAAKIESLRGATTIQTSQKTNQPTVHKSRPAQRRSCFVRHTARRVSCSAARQPQQSGEAVSQPQERFQSALIAARARESESPRKECLRAPRQALAEQCRALPPNPVRGPNPEFAE